MGFLSVIFSTLSEKRKYELTSPSDATSYSATSHWQNTVNSANGDRRGGLEETLKAAFCLTNTRIFRHIVSQGFTNVSIHNYMGVDIITEWEMCSEEKPSVAKDTDGEDLQRALEIRRLIPLISERIK